MFSPDGRKIAYIAEKNMTGGSFFEQNESEGQRSRGTMFEFNEDWGEQMEINHTCVFVLTLQQGCKPAVIDLPDESCTRPFWINNQKLGFVSYKESPKRLRLFSCLNRVSLSKDFRNMLKVSTRDRRRRNDIFVF